MCDEAGNDPLSVLIFFLIGLLQVKLLKNFFNALYTYNNIIYFNDNSGNVTFSCNKMGILSIDLNNINFDNSYDDDDPETIIYVRPFTWHS